MTKETELLIKEPVTEDVLPYHIRMLEDDKRRFQILINRELENYKKVSDPNAIKVMDLRISIWNRSIADINSAIHYFQRE